MDNNTVQGLAHVEATLNYLADGSERPVSYAYTPPPGIPQTTRRNSPQTVTIRNARPILSQLSLDRQGFELTHQDSKVTNFYDDKEVREVYYPEVERLLKETTGAAKVVKGAMRSASTSRRSASMSNAKSPRRSRTPTLLTRISRRPCLSRMPLNAFSTAAASVISNCNGAADPPLEVTVATARSRLSWLRPLTRTSAPALARALAISNPSPRPPPVTRAIFPSKENSGDITLRLSRSPLMCFAEQALLFLQQGLWVSQH